MGTLRIIEPGLFSTVQDLGRPGCLSLGVARGGAADAVSLRIGNRLVGNDEGAAAIEMTLTGIACEFESPGVVAVTGARMNAVIESTGGGSRTCRPGTPEAISAGETLRIGRFDLGCRACLCVAGGFEVPARLGSASTLASAGFGGHEGRTLRAADRLTFGSPRGASRAIRAEELEITDEILTRRTLRAVRGPHHELFPAQAIERFWSSSCRVMEQSDRMGVRLDTDVGAATGEGRMISEGMMPGAVQIPGDGRPIVLMCDHPTTGGYPVIACVASVDLPVLAQLRPREIISWEMITVERAWELLRDRDRRLAVGGVE